MHAVPALRAGLGSELLPLGQGGRAAIFESWSIDAVTFGAEVIVDIGVDGSEFLQGLWLSESQHCSLSLSNSQMAVPHAIVGTAADLLLSGIAQLDHCRAVRSKPICDDHLCCAMTFQRFAMNRTAAFSVS